MRNVLLIIFLLFISCLVFAQKNGISILQSAISKLDKMKDYRYNFIYIEAKGEKEEKSEYIFYFMKENFRRLEGIEGEHKGTIVVYNPEENKEKVKVKRGFIPLTMDKDDERLSGFFHSDFGSHLTHLSKYIKQGKIKFVKKEKFQGKEVNVVEFIPVKKMKYTKEIVLFDAEENTLVKIERYKDNKFHSKIIFKDISINTDLKPEDFKF